MCMSSIGLQNFVEISPTPAELWRHIHFEDGGHGIAILLPVSFLVTSLNYGVDMIARYLEPLRISGNKRPPIGQSATDVWRHIDLSRWRPRRWWILLPFCDFAQLGMSKSTSRPNLGVMSIHGWDITTSGLWKQTPAMLELYYLFRFSLLRHHRYLVFHLPTKFHPNRTIHGIFMTSYQFLKMGPRHRNSTSGFVFGDFTQLGLSKSTYRLNFGEISQSTAEILLLPVSENKYWNSTSGVDFHYCIITGISFGICVPTFIGSDHLH